MVFRLYMIMFRQIIIKFEISYTATSYTNRLGDNYEKNINNNLFTLNRLDKENVLNDWKKHENNDINVGLNSKKIM